MPLMSHGALRAVQLQSLEGERLFHGFFTRLGGVSFSPYDSLNMGHTVGDDPAAVETNHQLLFRALGLTGQEIVNARQVHGDRVARVTAADRGTVIADTDALVSDSPGVTLLMRFADCVPLIYWAPKQGAFGLAHGGWRGSVQGIAAKTARAMSDMFGCRPDELRVGIGPSIGTCCYQVGPEVIAQVREAMPDYEGLFSKFTADGRANLDLQQLNVRYLHRVGVKQIQIVGLCTACRTDLFFSHRAERGLTGRFAVVVGLREGP